MVNNYPEYAAGISYQKAEEGEKHFYNAQVKVDPSDDSMSAVLTKDGEVISELPDGGGGGGDSDFEIADLEIINNAVTTTIVYGAFMVTEEPDLIECPVGFSRIQGTVTVTEKAIIHKNNSIFVLRDEGHIFSAATGDVTITDPSAISVKGSGSVTIIEGSN